MKHIDDDLASAFEDGGGATAPLNFPSPSSNSIATNAVLHISSFSLDLTFKENCQETACFNAGTLGRGRNMCSDIFRIDPPPLATLPPGVTVRARGSLQQCSVSHGSLATQNIRAWS